ncbi:MAG: type IX secretion system protein PorQ [Chitinophagaceae bacterium]|nr:type IX secretion system protein PorQ [Chitinophagaceae bacterium]
MNYILFIKKNFSLIYFFFFSTVIFFVCKHPSQGQSITDTYRFLQIPIGSRQAALGGHNISLSYGNLSLVYSNPALLDSVPHNSITYQYTYYFVSSSFHHFAYNYSLKEWGNIALGLVNFGYGSFTGYDIYGNQQGNFSVDQTGVKVSYSNRKGHFVMGVSAQYVSDNIASYYSNGLLFDIGSTFDMLGNKIIIGICFKNIGWILKNYTNRELIVPFDMQLGITFKPEKLPIRFSITGTDLIFFRKLYYDPSGKIISKTYSPGVVRNVLQHISFGAEILIKKSVIIMLGYNYKANQELSNENSFAFLGISGGLSVKIKAMELSVAIANYHTSVINFHVGLQYKLPSLLKKRYTHI